MQALAGLDASQLLASRDANGDVGTTITGAAEQDRPNLHALALANGSRATEALRSLEESLKLHDAVVATRIERVRYRTYDLARDLALRLAGSAPRQWTVCVIVTESMCTMPWLHVAKAALDGGADCLQLREKELDGGELLARGAALRELTRAAGASLVINDRIDVALACHADGVHLGQSDLPIAAARAIAGSTLFIGASTHGPDEAAESVTAGASYCGVGCMYPSTTKAALPIAGPAYLVRFLAEHPNTPHLAIGGIDEHNARELAGLGCRGVAVSRSVLAASDPAVAVRRLRGALARG
ncbi:MAG: thiamine phosphate synthase [Phycisphaerae bacterium]|nr:thiamine phosphate synthase [Phycisphaerae bacterium]